MNDKQKAIRTSSKVISVIMKVGYIAMIVGMCVCLSSLVFLAITGGDTSILTSGGIRIIAFEDAALSGAQVAVLSVAYLVICAFLFSVFFLASRMFGEISRTANPFNQKYVGIIKVIGILVAVMTVVGDILNSAVAAYVGNSAYNMFTDSTGVIFGAIIFCLAYIFDYGCALQKQSDETL